MNLRFVIDMNLSPEWVEALGQEGWHAVHWSSIGAANSPDASIMDWALDNGHIVFTHDLDFTTLLALTRATGPSVLQLRGRATLPEDIGAMVFVALKQHATALENGALVVVDLARFRVRVLPI